MTDLTKQVNVATNSAKTEAGDAKNKQDTGSKKFFLQFMRLGLNTANAGDRLYLTEEQRRVKLSSLEPLCIESKFFEYSVKGELDYQPGDFATLFSDVFGTVAIGEQSVDELSLRSGDCVYVGGRFEEGASRLRIPHFV